MTASGQHRYSTRKMGTGARGGGWTELQRREGQAVLDWLDGEERLHKGFEALATGLRATLRGYVGTASEAREVWLAAPAVLANCNDPTTYDTQQAAVAYTWLHLLDRYVRTWLALARLLERYVLPMGRRGVRVLDVGTGPGPAGFATHDFYAAIDDYSRDADSPRWGQPADVICVERAVTMNRIRHVIAEHLALKGARQSVFGVTRAFDEFGWIMPTRERRRIEKDLRNECDEWYDEEREEWCDEASYTAEEANRAANAEYRYRLFTFSNFFTTLDMVSTFRMNLKDIFADARAGSVLLMIGAKGGSYPAIGAQVAELAEAGGFRRTDNAVAAAGSRPELVARLGEEVRWFYGELKQLAGSLRADETAAVSLRKELEGDKPVAFSSSNVQAFRKWS